MNIPFIPNNHIIRETDVSREKPIRKISGATNNIDQATIGEESKTVSRLLNQLRNIQRSVQPDLKTLKQRILAGTYNPSPEDIARAILFGPPRTG